MRDGRKTRALAIAVAATSLCLAANLAAQTRWRLTAANPSNNTPRKRLPVDPALKFVSLFGTAATTYAVAVDQAGNSYIGGMTELQGFTTTPGAFQTAPPPDSLCGAFVAKIDPSGALVYSTFLCGSSPDLVYGIAVDSAGDAYVTGWAVSSDFPTTPGAFQPACVPYLLNGSPRCADAFVAELNPTGSALIYSSYLGGANVAPSSNLGQYGAAIAVDSSGAAYVTGQTNASDFPTTPGAFQTTFTPATCGTSTEPAPCSHAFLTKVAPGASSLVYSTFLEGSYDDQGLGVAVDSTGDAFVVGGTTSLDFPTANAFQPTCNTFTAGGSTFCGNAFVTELNPSGSAPVFSTYLGGSFVNAATAVALDSDGNVYVIGWTRATDFPVVNAFQSSLPSTAAIPQSPFVAEVAAGGGSLVYSTYLGGSGDDYATGVAVDGFGEAFAAGNTVSTDFPVFNAIQSTNQGALEDAFVTGFQAGGQGLIYSTYLGGGPGSSTAAVGITVDSQGDAWVGGSSNASTFGTSAGRQVAARRYGSPRKLATSSGTAALAAAISLDAGRVSAAPASLVFGPELAGGTSDSQAVTISNPGTAPLQFSDISASNSFAVASGGTCSTSGAVAPNGNCTVNVAFAPTMGGDLTGALTLADNGIGRSHTVALAGTGQDFALSANSATASVSPGSTATYALSIAPEGGFDQQIALGCIGGPPFSECTVSPNHVVPDGASPASVTVSVKTYAASLAAPDLRNAPRAPLAPVPFSAPPPALWAALLGLAGLARLVRLGTGRLGLRGIAARIALLAAIAMSASCGGGGSNTVQNPGTPKGDYTLTITARTTAGTTTITHTLTLDFKVN
jgi:Abnormal spindle-like microcephaly-assoc'd, ASPM-SPD-2-Hydin/Beta-propeller repeat